MAKITDREMPVWSIFANRPDLSFSPNEIHVKSKLGIKEIRNIIRNLHRKDIIFSPRWGKWQIKPKNQSEKASNAQNRASLQQFATAKEILQQNLAIEGQKPQDLGKFTKAEKNCKLATDPIREIDIGLPIDEGLEFKVNDLDLKIRIVENLATVKHISKMVKIYNYSRYKIQKIVNELCDEKVLMIIKGSKNPRYYDPGKLYRKFKIFCQDYIGRNYIGGLLNGNIGKTKINYHNYIFRFNIIKGPIHPPEEYYVKSWPHTGKTCHMWTFEPKSWPGREITVIQYEYSESHFLIHLPPLEYQWDKAPDKQQIIDLVMTVSSEVSRIWGCHLGLPELITDPHTALQCSKESFELLKRYGITGMMEGITSDGLSCKVWLDESPRKGKKNPELETDDQQWVFDMMKAPYEIAEIKKIIEQINIKLDETVTTELTDMKLEIREYVREAINDVMTVMQYEIKKEIIEQMQDIKHDLSNSIREAIQDLAKPKESDKKQDLGHYIR